MTAENSPSTASENPFYGGQDRLDGGLVFGPSAPEVTAFPAIMPQTAVKAVKGVRVLQSGDGCRPKRVAE